MSAINEILNTLRQLERAKYSIPLRQIIIQVTSVMSASSVSRSDDVDSAIKSKGNTD